MMCVSTAPEDLILMHAICFNSAGMQRRHLAIWKNT